VNNLVHNNQPDHHEERINAPYDQMNPDTLRNMVEEYVTREWSNLSGSGYTQEEKVEQVLQQLEV